jgi:hypothetical protein
MIRDLTEFTDIVIGQVIDNAGELQKQFSVDMLQQFARDTPVDEGYATANWTASIGRPDLTPKNETDKSVTARKTARKALNDIESLQGVNTEVFISNAVQGRIKVGKKLKSGKRSKKRFDSHFTGKGYIIQLEEGKSKQAPNGMFLKNIAKASDIANKSKSKIYRNSRASNS